MTYDIFAQIISESGSQAIMDMTWQVDITTEQARRLKQKIGEAVDEIRSEILDLEAHRLATR